MKGYLTITNNKEILHIPSDNIVYVAGDRNYSEIVLADGKKRVVTCQLGILEDLMTSQLGSNGRHLVRIGKSLIINMRYLFYINPNRQELVLSDCSRIEFNLSASKEALLDLKTYLEKNIDTQLP